MSGVQDFDDFIIKIEKLSLERSYDLLHDAISKNIDILGRNMPLLDELFDRLDISQHSLIIMAILYIKFMASIIMDYDLAYIQFEKLINSMDAKQIMNSLDIFMNLCHSYTDTLIKQKIPIKGISILIKALTSIQSSPSQLTSLHADICHLCLSSRCLQPAISILDTDILTILKEGKSFDSKYFLLYYYYGGLIYLAYKKYQRALYFFEQAITAPAIVVSLIMVEAFKKYIITSLILHNKVMTLPKYTSNVVSRFIKPLCQPYIDIAQTYVTNNSLQLESRIAEHAEVLDKDGNMGLIKICQKALYKNNIKRLTQIYTTLSLTKVGTLAKLPDFQNTEQLLIEMIHGDEIYGKINKKDDIITFFEEPECFVDPKTLEYIDKQADHCMQLQSIINTMNKNIGITSQYIQKSMGIPDEETGSSSTKMPAQMAS